MKASQIISKLDLAQNGSFKSITTQTSFTSKDGQTFTNTVKHITQNNINYANRKDVKNAIASGLRDEPVLRDCYEKVVVDGVKLNRHKTTGQLYVPVNILKSQKAEIRNENGELVSKDEIRVLQFDSENKPSFMKRETTITNLEKKISLASDEEKQALQAKLEGYKKPSTIGQALHITPKLETVIAIS